MSWILTYILTTSPKNDYRIVRVRKFIIELRTVYCSLGHQHSLAPSITGYIVVCTLRGATIVALRTSMLLSTELLNLIIFTRFI